MPDLFESEVTSVHVACSDCGTPLELASSALSVFGSQDAVLCMDCLLRKGGDGGPDAPVPLPERIHMIDETVDEFAKHMRNVLMRCVKPDLSWNREYGLDDWPDPMDLLASAYAPGIWYAMRNEFAGRRRRNDEPDY